MIQLSGRFLKYNIIDKNGVQFPKSATINAKMCPDQLITIAEMEADARRAIPADKIKTGSKED